MAPTLATACAALPPEGAELRLGRPDASFMAPTLATACAALPPEGAGLASEARPALWPMAPRFSLSHTSQKTAARRQSASKPCGGFTLIELLVAISVMALLAVLSWRGLDGMARSQAQTSQRADEVLNLQAGLDQWKVDLDSLTQTPQIGSLDWDGRVLRLTRRATTGSDGLIVVAWTRRA